MNLDQFLRGTFDIVSPSPQNMGGYVSLSTPWSTPMAGGTYQWWSLGLINWDRDWDGDLIIRDLTIRDRDHPSETETFKLRDRDRRPNIYLHEKHNFFTGNICLHEKHHFFSLGDIGIYHWSNAFFVPLFSFFCPSGLVVSIETETFEPRDLETETHKIRSWNLHHWYLHSFQLLLWLVLRLVPLL